MFDLQRFAGEFEVNGTAYDTLQTALTAAKSGDTVKLTADATNSTYLGLSKDITLDLNGHTLTSTNYLLQVNAGYKLTVTDSSEDQSGSISSTSNYCVLLKAGADLDMTNVTLKDNTSSGGCLWVYLYADSTATANINDETVSNYPGTINLTNVTADTKGGRIVYSPETVSTGSYISKYEINVTGGEYTSTMTGTGGSHVFTLCGMKANFDGVTINSKTAGCVYVANRYDLTEDKRLDETFTSTSSGNVYNVCDGPEDAETNANATFENCNFTVEGPKGSSYSWCTCLISVAYANVAQIKSGTYTVGSEDGTTGAAYGLYAYSSNGGFIIDGGTFVNNVSDNLIQLDYNKTAYYGWYGYLNDGKPFAVINGGDFQLNGKGLKGGSATDGSTITITAGEFDGDIAELLEDNYWYTQVGETYYVTDKTGWVKSTTANVWLNATAPEDLTESREGTLVASLAGADSTLTLRHTANVTETIALDTTTFLSDPSYTAIDASAATAPVAITGNSSIKAITGGKGDDIIAAGTSATLDGGIGEDGGDNDSLKGSAGSDTFIYRGGSDTIDGYDAKDTVSLASDFDVSKSSFEASADGFILSFDSDDKLTFKNAVDTGVSIQSGRKTYVYTEASVSSGDGVTLSSAVAANTQVNYADNSTYKTIDASAATNAIAITANSLDNTISAGTGGGTINGGLGSDLLKGGTGADVFVYEKGSGKDVVEDFDTAADSISLGSGFSFTDVTSTSNKLTFKNGSDQLSFTNPGSNAKIALADGSYLSKDGKIAESKLELFAGAKGRVDIATVDSTITEIDATAADKHTVTLVGGTGGGTFTFANNNKADVFEYGSGNVTINNYEGGKDKIYLVQDAMSSFSVSSGTDKNVSIGAVGGVIVLTGAKGAEVNLREETGSYSEKVFYDTGVLHDKTRNAVSATVLAGAGDYEASESIKKITVTGLTDGINITSGNKNNMVINLTNAGAGISVTGGANTNDKITLGGGKDVVTYTGGKDVVNGFSTNDSISLGTYAEKLLSAKKISVSKNNVALKFDSSNTLDIKGATYDDTTKTATVQFTGETISFKNNAIVEGTNVSLTAGFTGSYKLDDSANYIDGSNVEKSLTFKGTSSEETLIGGAKKTTFRGGGGADNLVGGSGKDTFFYAKGDRGEAVIADFDYANDKIKIANGTITSIASVAASGSDPAGIRFTMNNGRNTNDIGSFFLTGSATYNNGEPTTATIDPSKTLIKANNTYYWFATEATTDVNDGEVKIGDLITSDSKVTTATVNNLTGYKVVDLSYSTNLTKSGIAHKVKDATPT